MEMRDMRKAKINGKLMSVVDAGDYMENIEIYSPNCTAISVEEAGVVLPIIGKFDKGVGIHPTDGLFSRINMPSEEEREEYSLDSVIDLAKCKDMAELIKTQQQIANIEYDMLTTVDNLFKPKIGENCTPAMRALKEAVIDKNIDIHKYSERYGANFNNNVRNFAKDDISLRMLELHCNVLDIKATLVLEDASDDVPNPIGHKISVELTRGGDIKDD